MTPLEKRKAELRQFIAVHLVIPQDLASARIAEDLLVAIEALEIIKEDTDEGYGCLTDGADEAVNALARIAGQDTGEGEK